ncbi:tumor necrosis factor ligand superfamily member 6-like [Haliotis rufescens]|uniref:tumor necrosis factor ligand superfamily member 6-like n=1 Tax=Haliotis rufescens TaxID=6454 RepID=UPI00201EB79B|nr:tumor necrosis factor ligand superfamily member 6-like [Haliotis rufescens]
MAVLTVHTEPRKAKYKLCDDASAPSLQWNQDYGYGSAYKGIDIKSDGQNLHITKPGLYHVYSFFTFKTHQPRQHPDNVLHTIRRSNAHLPNMGRTVLLMAKKTLPEASERFVTSYLSATVRLRQDDHVSVTVSNMSHVYRYPPSNFFGLYYVGE